MKSYLQGCLCLSLHVIGSAKGGARGETGTGSSLTKRF